MEIEKPSEYCLRVITPVNRGTEYDHLKENICGDDTWLLQEMEKKAQQITMQEPDAIVVFKIECKCHHTTLYFHKSKLYTEDKQDIGELLTADHHLN